TNARDWTFTSKICAMPGTHTKGGRPVDDLPPFCMSVPGYKATVMQQPDTKKKRTQSGSFRN
ncbi:hypothetical protein, partial [Faecalibaculum rodentium]|uniref:hypothetical protein n=1 Tax=Faecalibaculum rodentium TaxID=1702221 RepID=UPI00248FA7A5